MRDYFTTLGKKALGAVLIAASLGLGVGVAYINRWIGVDSDWTVVVTALLAFVTATLMPSIRQIGQRLSDLELPDIDV